MAHTKQISLRIPIDLLEQLRTVPKGKGTSYMIEAIRAQLERDKHAEIESGLKCLAYDDEANDISIFEEAQAEVIARLD